MCPPPVAKSISSASDIILHTRAIFLSTQVTARSCWVKVLDFSDRPESAQRLHALMPAWGYSVHIKVSSDYPEGSHPPLISS